MDLTGAGQAAVAGFPEECLGTAPTAPPPGAAAGADEPFSPAEQAALMFADQMTIGPGRVPHAMFQRLSERFGEAEIVEIAAVVGLFNYFNRFNNALEVEISR